MMASLHDDFHPQSPPPMMASIQIGVGSSRRFLRNKDAESRPHGREIQARTENTRTRALQRGRGHATDNTGGRRPENKAIGGQDSEPSGRETQATTKDGDHIKAQKGKTQKQKTRRQGHRKSFWSPLAVLKSRLAPCLVRAKWSRAVSGAS